MILIREKVSPSIWSALAAVWLSLCLATFPAAADLDPDFASTIDAFATNLVKNERVPGMSIAVAKGSDVIFARGYGFANVEEATEATADTIYRIGSVTKREKGIGCGDGILQVGVAQFGLFGDLIHNACIVFPGFDFEFEGIEVQPEALFGE